MENLITKITLRQDTTINWETNKNVVLALGEPAVEIVYDMATGLQVLDENNKPVLKFKIGDGVTTWENLNYQTGDFQTVLNQLEQQGQDISALQAELNTENTGIADRLTTVETKAQTNEEDIFRVNQGLTNFYNKVYPATTPGTLSAQVAANASTVVTYSDRVETLENNLETNYYTKQETESLLTSVYKYQGTKTVAQLNALEVDSSFNGYVYNVSDNGTLTQGSLVVKAGDNVVVDWDDTLETFTWDKFNGETGLQDNELIDRETSALPSATASSPDFVQLADNFYYKKGTDSVSQPFEYTQLNGGGSGSDVEIIVVPEVPTTPTASSPLFIEYQNQLYYRAEIVGEEASSFTGNSLRDTYWKFNDTIGLNDVLANDALINFVCPDESPQTPYMKLSYTQTTLSVNTYSHLRYYKDSNNSINIYRCTTNDTAGLWYQPQCQIIHIIDGDDVENTNLINWLQLVAKPHLKAYKYMQVITEDTNPKLKKKLMADGFNDLNLYNLKNKKILPYKLILNNFDNIELTNKVAMGFDYTNYLVTCSADVTNTANLNGDYFYQEKDNSFVKNDLDVIIKLTSFSSNAFWCEIQYKNYTGTNFILGNYSNLIPFTFGSVLSDVDVFLEYWDYNIEQDYNTISFTSQTYSQNDTIYEYVIEGDASLLASTGENTNKVIKNCTIGTNVNMATSDKAYLFDSSSNPNKLSITLTPTTLNANDVAIRVYDRDNNDAVVSLGGVQGKLIVYNNRLSHIDDGDYVDYFTNSGNIPVGSKVDLYVSNTSGYSLVADYIDMEVISSEDGNIRLDRQVLVSDIPTATRTYYYFVPSVLATATLTEGVETTVQLPENMPVYKNMGIWIEEAEPQE